MSLLEKIKSLFPTATLPNDVKSVGDTMLHNNFLQLVEHVELVVAQIYKMTTDTTYRSRNDGLKGLDWLKAQNVKDVKYQAALDEIRILYTWWTDLRVKRSNPWKGIDQSFGDFKDEWLNTTEDKNVEFKSFMDQCRHAEKIQEVYGIEDTKMLVRLINIRKYL
tara:strand:- start:233 stop:724 length:492 start_codon:yes stop_codon:yes gene_type:complete